MACLCICMNLNLNLMMFGCKCLTFQICYIDVWDCSWLNFYKLQQMLVICTMKKVLECLTDLGSWVTCFHVLAGCDYIGAYWKITNFNPSGQNFMSFTVVYVCKFFCFSIFLDQSSVNILDMWCVLFLFLLLICFQKKVKNGGWWRWAVNGVVPSWMVGVFASVNLSLHHKVQKFSSGTGSPGWSQKRAIKWLWCGDLFPDTVRIALVALLCICTYLCIPELWKRMSTAFGLGNALQTL